MIPTTQIHASNSVVKNHRIINRKSKIDLFVYSEFLVTFLYEVHDLVTKLPNLDYKSNLFPEVLTFPQLKIHPWESNYHPVNDMNQI